MHSFYKSNGIVLKYLNVPPNIATDLCTKHKSELQFNMNNKQTS